jgi:cyclic beta-1,2-glucan synthetase
LFGTGDWNDGMNRVGELGKGESVWLGWFLHATLSAFVPMAKARKDQAREAALRTHAQALQTALEREGWDGEWYRRGYFDDGTPLGSSASVECRIDSIAQSWGVISGAADPARAARAMAAVDSQLILRDSKLALLFTPPFDHTPLDPGYIKGYPPGIRENGGQYTHAAAWSVIAFASLGRATRPPSCSRCSTRSTARPRARTSPLQGRALHHRRRRLFGTAACRARRMDLVHRLGRVDVSSRHRIDSWPHASGRVLASCPLYPGALAALRDRVSTSRPRAMRSPSRIPTASIVRITRAELDGAALPAGPLRIPLADDGKTHRIRAVLG